MNSCALHDSDDSYPCPRPHPCSIPKGHKGCVHPRGLESRQGHLPLHLRIFLQTSLNISFLHPTFVDKPHLTRKATKPQQPNPLQPETLEKRTSWNYGRWLSITPKRTVRTNFPLGSRGNETRNGCCGLPNTGPFKMHCRPWTQQMNTSKPTKYRPK